jgi:hypothetical protein
LKEKSQTSQHPTLKYFSSVISTKILRNKPCNFWTAKSFNNPMEELYAKGLGSLKFYGKWMLFDQILLSKNFFPPKAKHLQFQEACIFNEPFLQNPKGPFKGQPFRTYSGKYYLGGYSDHFPVYVLLIKKA